MIKTSWIRSKGRPLLDQRRHHNVVDIRLKFICIINMYLVYCPFTSVICPLVDGEDLVYMLSVPQEGRDSTHPHR